MNRFGDLLAQSLVFLFLISSEHDLISAVSCALETDTPEISLLRIGQVQTRTCQSGERFIDGMTRESIKCTQAPGVEVTGRPHRQISNSCSGT